MVGTSGGDVSTRIEVAGAVEERSKGQGSIAVGAPLMLFIMFTLPMLQWSSFGPAMRVFVKAPRALFPS